MTEREEIQKQITDTILTEKDLITLVSIRVGKTRSAINAIEKDESVLVAYPFITIGESWQKELELVESKSKNITFTTFKGLKKYKDTDFDFLVIDEPQYLSDAQIKVLKTIKYKKRVGLTGTLKNSRIKAFQEELNWEIKYTYGLADAIRDKIVKDYEVNIHEVNFDPQHFEIYNAFGIHEKMSEHEVYTRYMKGIGWCERKKEELPNEYSKFDNIQKTLTSKVVNLLYNSMSLFESVEAFIKAHQNEKILIYTLRTDIADSLSDVSYHSKNKEEDNLERFKISKDGHMATVNCIQAGVTIRYLNRVVCHSYESNTEKLHQKLGRSLLYEYEGEKSIIDMFVLKDTIMERWVNLACKSLEQEKIFFINGDRRETKIDRIKSKFPGKELYSYNGSICYFSHEEPNGPYINKHYRFIETPSKSYPLNSDKLIKL